MRTPRREDEERKADAEQARALRLQRQATVDAKVKRAHEAGSSDQEIARELKMSGPGVKASRDRQGLKANVEVLSARKSY